MSLPTEVAEKILNNLAWFRKLVLPDLLKRIAEVRQSSADEETVRRATEYLQDLRTLGILIDQILGKIELDEETDPPLKERIRIFLGKRAA